MTATLRDDVLAVLAEYKQTLLSEFAGPRGLVGWADRTVKDLDRLMSELRVAKVEQA